MCVLHVLFYLDVNWTLSWTQSSLLWKLSFQACLLDFFIAINRLDVLIKKEVSHEGK